MSIARCSSGSSRISSSGSFRPTRSRPFALAETNKVVLAGNLMLAFVVDEESGACSPYGTRYLLDQGLLHADAVIIGEPGNDKIAIAHRGLYHFRLQTRGEAIHTGLKAWEQAARGRNAILDMARLAFAWSEWSLPA